MNVAALNYLNIALMLGSCLAAYMLPFELVVFSYAFLGPAHYLTEISWLHDRQYFTRHKNDFALLAALSVPITFAFLFGDTEVGPISLWLALICSITVTFFSSTKARLMSISLLSLIVFASYDVHLSNHVYLFVPTLVHVFVFTGAFILVGALRGATVSGVLSLVVFVLCAAAFFIVPPASTPLAQHLEATSGMRFFSGLTAHISELFKLPATPESASAIMGFISYAYTYHYLNWFSKTRVIRWHEISRARAAGVILAYLASIGLYLHDYELGFLALLYLSVLHVVLELPLNFKTIAAIAGVKINQPLRPGPSTASAA